MPLTEQELLERDEGRDIWQETLDAMRDLNAGKIGASYKVASNGVREARQKTGFTQDRFARLLGISVRTLQGWEQGRRTPTGAARTLIEVTLKHPQAVLDVADRLAA
jgi:putative transcriptional regulator